MADSNSVRTDGGGMVICAGHGGKLTRTGGGGGKVTYTGGEEIPAGGKVTYTGGEETPAGGKVMYAGGEETAGEQVMYAGGEETHEEKLDRKSVKAQGLTHDWVWVLMFLELLLLWGLIWLIRSLSSNLGWCLFSSIL